MKEKTLFFMKKNLKLTKNNTFNNFFLFKCKEFEIFPWKKRRFRFRWDSSPGLSIAGQLINFFLLWNFFCCRLLPILKK